LEKEKEFEMANKTETVTLNKGAGVTDETVTQTWVDQGDGTHAPKAVATLSGEDVTLAPGTYLGQQVIAGNDSNQNATIPAGTTVIYVMAEGGPVGCTVNGTSASVAAAGYHCPENAIRLIGPFSNITSLGVFAATGDNAHLIYES
jgi:hypothetical protein